MRLKIRHNAEIAHRLSLDTSKCQQIHGHSLQIQLTLVNLGAGPDGKAINTAGEELDFGAMKRKFRNHIDSTYDHRLVLNVADEWAQPIFGMKEIKTWLGPKDLTESDPEEVLHVKLANEQKFLPGLSTVIADPTIENLCKWIATWAAETFRCEIICSIDETNTNGAEVNVTWNGFGAAVRT